MLEEFVLLCYNNSGVVGFNVVVVMASCLVWFVMVVVLGSSSWVIKNRRRKVYLVDFCCYKAGPEYMCTTDHFMEASRHMGCSTEEIAFQKKILERSGMGQKTYIPESLREIPSNLCVAEARKEAEMVIYGNIDQLLTKTRLKADQIGILVVNCSMFCPSPSFSSMIVNRFKLREDILTYDLTGMGCSAGLISIDLVKHLFQVYPESYALVVSLETLTLNYYKGNNRSMLVTNCLFRMGGGAILLSNKSSEKGRSKYQLIHSVRTHKGSDDRSYGCVIQEDDDDDVYKAIGISLSKDLMAVAGEALKTNITLLGPLVLPWSEQFWFFASLIARKIIFFRNIIKKKTVQQQYVPDFKLAFEHFCIHAGGKAVLDEIEKSLNLTGWHMEPSRMTLYRFGNTSSSSLWYELAYSEAKGRIKKGDRIWQIAFGSGFKCNSVVWRALRTINPTHEEKNPWTDEIYDFPVNNNN